MKQGLLSLAGIALAMAVAMPAHALTNSIANFPQGTFNLAQAYPCTVGTYPTSEGISDLRVWSGVCGNNNVTVSDGSTFPGATPGLLCLARNGLNLDVNCFAVADGKTQFGPCFVQAFFLRKLVPGSFKCPDVYGQPHFFVNGDGDTELQPYTYIQFGSGIRTWWALNFTQPGTRFLLTVVSVCRTAPVTNGQPGPASVHEDTWEWRVVASPETMAQLIEVMHGAAVSTLEVPCIIGEDMYDALKSANGNLASAVTGGNTTTIGNAIFDYEALIVANCLFVDVLDPLQAFPGAMQTFSDGTSVPGIQPPSNLAPPVQVGTGGTAIAGIIDTIENPCCCKLLVDLEYIAIFNGVIGQVPHLPVIQAGGRYDPDTTGVNGS